MKYFLTVPLIFFSAVTMLRAQQLPHQPKLVVGIVVDQMRYDFLYRYWDNYSEGGFKRLVNKGHSFENTHYNYVPTYTGPGHAAIYTGTSPSVNGIVSNDWYDRQLKRLVYVTEDASVQTIGSSSTAGQMSPKYLLSTTITDELELFTNGRAKVIGVALKDRGSILPAGHAADAAYWFDPATGNFISSSFYISALPQWVTAFNDKKSADRYLGQEWKTLLPKEKYLASTADDVTYEIKFKGEDKPVFPHALPVIRANYDFGLINRTPFGNSLTLDFALEALKNEQMGQDNITDFLALSFSSTDYVGHQFGLNAIETEDTYIRLDRELERLFAYLDKNIGSDNVLIFLTADHGAMNAIGHLKANRIPTGVFRQDDYLAGLRTYLASVYGPGEWIEFYENQQVHLDRNLVAAKKLSLKSVQQSVVDYSIGFDGIAQAISGMDLITQQAANPLTGLVQRGYAFQRSGDVMLVFAPGIFDAGHATNGGTTHGSSYAYDTHVPLIFMGNGIAPGRSSQAAYITDIAPTVAFLLGIMEPSGTTGKVLDIK